VAVAVVALPVRDVFAPRAGWLRRAVGFGWRDAAWPRVVPAFPRRGLALVLADRRDEDRVAGFAGVTTPDRDDVVDRDDAVAGDEPLELRLCWAIQATPATAVATDRSRTRTTPSNPAPALAAARRVPGDTRPTASSACRGRFTAIRPPGTASTAVTAASQERSIMEGTRARTRRVCACGSTIAPACGLVPWIARR
jgi:hypothetical protein